MCVHVIVIFCISLSKYLMTLIDTKGKSDYTWDKGDMLGKLVASICTDLYGGILPEGLDVDSVLPELGLACHLVRLELPQLGGRVD